MTLQTLHFALSAIALCTAIGFAFLGAFVIFRTQTADAILKDLSFNLIAITTRAKITTDIPGLIAARKYEVAFERLSIPGNASQSIQSNHVALMEELQSIIKLRKEYRQLVGLSLGLIGASIAALALADSYAVNSTLSTLVLFVAFVWFARVLMMTEKLIRTCFFS